MGNSLEPIHVLVVDDEENIRDGSERTLSSIGFQVFKASKGSEALDILSGNNISIILLDLKMPGMDGMEVLGRIQKMFPAILVIVITGYATVQTAIEAMKQGAYDFIPKPFEPDQLRMVVRRAAEKIRLVQEAENLANEKRRTLLDLHTEKSRLHTILQSLPNGVLVTNAQGRVVLLNTAFLKQLDLNPDSQPGKNIEDYIPDNNLCNLVLEISRGKHVALDDIPTYEFALSDKKYLLARGRPILSENRECLGAVINVVDITAMKVLDRLKTEFVAKVSHELRSPLATIHAQLALVIQNIVASAVQVDHQILSRAKEKTRGLISIIGDLLDLSRIESGIICREPEPVRLDDILRNVMDFLKTSALGKKQSISLEIFNEPLPMVSADPVALESIFGNLISNAISYTPEGGKIHVRADLADAHIRIRVTDNGFGIEKRHLDKIFEKFYRIKNEKTRYITGTGLGLPIVKELVTSMGGFIEVESTPEKGSTFMVLFPVSMQSGD
ncbi:MAG: response regulator [Desulfobacterales bacterium]|nr:response regulator [Desulfobacterales bacterium]